MNKSRDFAFLCIWMFVSVVLFVSFVKFTFELSDSPFSIFISWLIWLAVFFLCFIPSVCFSLSKVSKNPLWVDVEIL